MGSHNTKKSRVGGGGGGHSTGSSRGNTTRPHTAACDTAERVPFEWPPPPPPPLEIPKRGLDEPLPSDMEVLCSDVEQAFQDR